MTWGYALLTAALFAAGMCALAGMVQTAVHPGFLILGCVLGGTLTCLQQRWRRRAAIGVLLTATLIAGLQWAVLMDGMQLAAMRLFAASEAVNRYRYITLITPTDPEAVRLAWQCLGLVYSLIGAAVCVGAVRYRPVALMLAVGMAAIQVYFGVTPAWGCNVCWFLLCGLVLLGAALDAKNAGLMAALAAVVVLAVVLTAPGVHQPLEDASEQLRDRLDAWLKGSVAMESVASDTVNETRLENRLQEQQTSAADTEAANVEAYEKTIRYQEEISAPHVLNLRRMALWFAVLLTVLVVPFVPFYWWDRRRKQAQARRIDFTAEDAALAVRAMLVQIDRCLRFAAPVEDNTAMNELPDALWGRVPDALCHQLTEVLSTWYKAVYSDHPVSDEERAHVEQLLNDTEQWLRQTGDLRQRMRLQWMALLPDEVEA